MSKTKKRVAQGDNLLDWQFPNAEAWAQTQSPVASSPALSQRRRRGWIAGSVALLLIATVGVVYWLWRQAKHEDQRSKTALLQMITRETGSGDNEHNPVSGTLLYQETADHWRRVQQDQKRLLALVLGAAPATTTITVEDVTWQGEFAVVRVLVTKSEAAGDPLGYRQTRVYRSTATGWLPTVPVAALWGPVHSLKTGHFTFLFREQDQQAVAIVAASVDELYATLRQDFGLPMAAPSEQIVIELALTAASRKALDAPDHPPRIVVPSPTLLPVATQLAVADVLAQHIVAALAVQVSATAKGGEPWEWYNLITAVRRWQLWQHNAALTAWQHQVTVWLYSTAPTTPNDAAPALADTAAAICRKAPIMEAAAPASVPVLTPWCARPNLLPQLLASGKPALRLHDLAAPTVDWARHESDWPDWYHYKPLETLIDYAAITYGRERLPVLMTALGHHHNWETLIPTVFHVSAAEFERGWQAYLAAHYGVSVAYERGSK